MKKVKQDVRQICIALQRGEIGLEDAKRLAEELEQELVLTRRRTIVLGSILVILAFYTAATVSTRHRPKTEAVAAALPPVNPVGLSYVPKHTLPRDALWVISYQRNDAHATLPASTNQPFSEEWVKHAAYHLILGRQALDQNLPKEATVHLEEALTIFPDLRGVHALLGTVYLELDEPAPAIRHLKAALREEESVLVLNNLGAACLKQGEAEQAEEFLRRAEQLDPGYAAGLKNLALLYRETDRPEKALRYFEDYLSRYRDDPDTAEIYADYLVDQGRRDEAVAFLEEYSRRNEAQALPLYLLLAEIESAATNSAAAAAALEKACSLISPNLALIELNRETFDPVRETDEFKKLVQQVELAAVTLEETL